MNCIEDQNAFEALIVLDYLLELFTGTGEETFTREQILVILNAVKNDPEIFSPEAVLAYESAVENLG